MISITIGGINRDSNIDYKTLSIVENLYSHANVASFEFHCKDFANAPVNGEEIIMIDNLTRIFAGRILSKEENFLPPSSYRYFVDCIDYHRDLDRKLVNETYEDLFTGAIVRDIIAKYCTGLTAVNVADGVLIDGRIVFDYILPSDCIKQLAELSLYSWYVDYNKDVHFFTQAVPNAPFEINDNQEYYQDLVFSYDFSQLRNKVRVKGLGDINVVKQNDASIAYIQGIEGGDGIYEHIIIDETITTVELAEQIVDADLNQYKDIYIIGSFITNQKDVKAGQLMKVDSIKRNISQNYLVQEVSLEKITIGGAEDGIPDVSYKPAVSAEIGYKPAAIAEVPYKKSGEVKQMVYYVYNVTIASRLKDLIGLLLDMLHQQGSILPSKDVTPPAVPSGLTLYTGMGLTTQATLAWLKAEWNANSEPDLSYYELRMKKSTDSVFTIVSTKNISFIWYSLEPGVTFDVYIRAFDTSGNASNWSSVKSKTTATDQDVPVQLSKPTVIALFAGVKVNWNMGVEDNLAYYKIERQESTDNVNWSGWSTIANVDATMWLDLFLTYAKYYRYRVSSVTQTGNSGTPSDPSNSIQPKQAATADIEALAITASLLASNAVTEGKIAANAVTEGKIIANAIVSDKIAANAIVSNKIAALAIITDKIAASAITTVKIQAGAITTDCILANAVTADKIAANSIYTNALQAGAITASKIAALTITGDKIAAGAITAAKISVTSLAAITATLGSVTAGNIRTTRLQVGGTTNEDIYFEDSGIRLYDAGSNNIYFSASTSSLTFNFGSNYVNIKSTVSNLYLSNSAKTLVFYSGGTLQMVNLTSSPAGHAGDLAYNSSSHRFAGFIGGSDNKWGHWLLSSGW